MKWISVEDRLPEDDVSALCFLSNGFVCMVHFFSGEWVEMWGIKIMDVLYWMPLPKHPERQTKQIGGGE